MITPRPLLSAAFLLSLAGVQAFADGPDPREVPPPPIQTSLGSMPGVDQLPDRPELPDFLVMNDGSRVTNLDQWGRRREEMRRILEYYAVGQMPPPPGNVRGSELSSQTVLDGSVRYRLVHLTFGPDSSLGLDVGLFMPTRGGPFPAIILQGGPPPGSKPLPRLPPGPNQGHGQDVLLWLGDKPVPGVSAPLLPPPRMAARPGGPLGGPSTPEAMARRYAEVFRRGYALAEFNPNDCAEDTTLREADGSWAFRHTRFFPAYPGYDWGILAAWAWGASRVADYLVTDPAVNSRVLVITGASRDGKSALIAAAFDDRLIGAPVVTGGGGIGAYRYEGADGSESLDIMQKKYPNWFSPHLHQFWGHRERLPFDEHWFVALCAPRPFIALEGDADVISLPEAVRQSLRAAQPAYALYGVSGRIGVHYSHHPHAFTPEDWTALMDFVDQTALGRDHGKTFDRYLTPEERKAALAELNSRR